MAVFHILSKNIWKHDMSKFKEYKVKYKEDVNNTDWFMFGERLYDDFNKVHYINLKNTTKIFDGNTGIEYELNEELHLVEIKSKDVWNEKVLLKNCDNIPKKYNGGCIIHKCKSSGVCIATIILCDVQASKYVKNFVKKPGRNKLLKYMSNGGCIVDVIDQYEDGVTITSIVKGL